MSRYFLFIVFFVSVFVPHILRAQQLVYENQKKYSYYFDKPDSQNDAIFNLLGNNLSSAAYFKYEFTIRIEVYKTQNKYSVSIKAIRNNVECRYRYRGFLMSDFMIADNINIKGELIASSKQLMVFDMKNKEIPLSSVILDTSFVDNSDLNYFRFTTSDIKFFMNDKSIIHLKQGLKKIDNFFHYDSLYADWSARMDAMNMSDIDRIPVYQFQLEDIEHEIAQHDKNEYEVLLSRSGKDNQEYLHNRSVLLNRIAELKLELSKKLSVMDVLMFESGKQFEEQHDLEKAIFYYNRALDYNPLHCEALEKLSDLYIHNNLHQQNLDLFTGLRIRGEDISCESTLTSSVCDSMCMKANNMIFQRNYYDAIKFLDTLELLIYQMPDTSYMQMYYNLKKQAQEGIYDSYFEIIGRATRNNKLEIGKEYIYGLTDIMRKDKNNPSENRKYMQVMERFLSRYMENIRSSLRRWNYSNVIYDNDVMLAFLDSIAYSYQKTMFKDSYTASHTAVYQEKKRYSERDAANYLRKHSDYITVASEQEKLLFEKNKDVTIDESDKNRYDFLMRYILQWDVNNDFSVLDSLLEFVQMEEKDASSHALANRQVLHIISEVTSKVNQLAWNNELLQADKLMGAVKAIVPFLNLQQTDSALFENYNQTTILLHNRFAQQAEWTYNNLVSKTEKLIDEKEYLQAYNLLNKKDIILEQSIHQPHINRLIENLRLPATFQEKMLAVEQNLALGDFIAGFILYEDGFNYFVENNIEQYGLNCDSLLVFLKKRTQSDFVKSALVFFMGNNDHANAVDMMMYATDLGYLNEDLQVQLGEKMKAASYSFALLKEKYTFTKAHNPFLKSFLGKSGAFWYHVKQWKLFNSQKKTN